MILIDMNTGEVLEDTSRKPQEAAEQRPSLPLHPTPRLALQSVSEASRAVLDPRR